MAIESYRLCSYFLDEQNDLCYVSITDSEFVWKVISDKKSDLKEVLSYDGSPSLTENAALVNHVNWEDVLYLPASDKPEVQRIPLSEVIAVKRVERQIPRKLSARLKKYSNDPALTHKQIYELQVSVLRRVRDYKWRVRNLVFSTIFGNLTQHFQECIQTRISDFKRPKHLLVFINPVGGKKQGCHIFRHKVAPFFDLADITYNVIVTTHVNHAKDYLFSCSLDTFDGVVSVGGDGTFVEVLHGVMAHTYRRRCGDGRLGPTPREEPLRPNITLGIIPAGSTDTMAWSLHGCNDATTAALHIVLGDSLPMDVATVHCGDQFVKYNVSMLGYGYYGDLLVRSERYQCLGPHRYDWAGVQTFLSHRSYEGELHYIASENCDSHPRDQQVCLKGCSVCDKVNKELDLKKMTECQIPNSGDEPWQSIRGRFAAINAFVITCRCRYSNHGPAPNAHLGDGCMDLVIVRACSRTSFFRHLHRCTQRDEDQFDLECVEVLRVKAFKFEPRFGDDESCAGASINSRDSLRSRSSRHAHAQSAWNCDGEVVQEPTLCVRAHGQVVRMFGCGVEDISLYPKATYSCVSKQCDSAC